MPVGKTLEFTYVSVKILATSRTGEVCFLSQSEPARFDVLKSRLLLRGAVREEISYWCFPGNLG